MSRAEETRRGVTGVVTESTCILFSFTIHLGNILDPSDVFYGANVTDSIFTERGAIVGSTFVLDFLAKGGEREASERNPRARKQ